MGAPSRATIANVSLLLLLVSALALILLTAFAVLVWNSAFEVVGRAALRRLPYLGPILAAGALASSVVFAFAVGPGPGRRTLVAAGALHVVSTAIFAWNGWEWYQIETGAAYCTGCFQFLFLPLFGMLAAIVGLVLVVLGRRQWRAASRGPGVPGP